MSGRLAWLFVLGVSFGAVAQQPAPGARAILEAHISHGIGDSPFDSDLWHDETNAALIVRARSGATLAELQPLVGDGKELDSRLASLRRQGFLRLHGDVVRTTFPILIGDAHDRYMRLVAETAGRIDSAMRDRWLALLDQLRARGWAEWSYHFVWSQTMDSGFTWAPMMEQGHVPPLSTLIVWVVFPAHPFKSGTNYYPDTELRDQMIAVTWRPRTANTIVRVGREWPSVWSAAVNGRVTPEERQRLAALGLVDDGGRVRVPMVKKEEKLYAHLEALGSEHVRLVATHLPLSELRALAAADEQVTFAMAYHDVSWEILRRMVDSGTVVPPPALREGARDDVSMAGVCAVVDSHPAFVRELRKALGIK